MSRAPRRGRGLAKKPAPAPVLVAPASIPTWADIVGDGKRCGICCQVYPVLVDDVLCIRCDAVMWPNRPRLEAS